MVNRLLFFRFYAEPSKQKENLSEKLLVSSEVLMKIWYFSDRIYISELGGWVRQLNLGPINQNLSPLIAVYYWVSLLLLSFPFSFLLQFEADYFKSREFIGPEGDSRANSRERGLKRSLRGRGDEQQDWLEGGEDADFGCHEELREAFKRSYGFLDQPQFACVLEEEGECEEQITSLTGISDVGLGQQSSLD